MVHRKLKSTAALLVLMSFLVIGVFGFAFMGHTGGHESQKCIVAVAEGATCAKTSIPLDSALFHLNAFKSFSLGAFQLMVLAVGIVLLSFGSSRWLAFVITPPEQARYRTQRAKSPSFHYKARWLRWLAMNRKTDSF